MRQYTLRELYNLEYIIVLFRDLKHPTTVLNTSITTDLSAEYKKDPTMVMTQTEDIKKFVKKRSTLRQNIINIYGLIW